MDPGTVQLVELADSEIKFHSGGPAIPAIIVVFSQFVQSDEGASDCTQY